MVRSLVQFKVKFDDPTENAKVFLIKNLGVIRIKNKPPASWTGSTDPINLNLPIFL